jgi:membrane protein required for beta-lactamase induction
MTFTAILLALFAERFLLDDGSWRKPFWLQRFLQGLSDTGYGDWLMSRYWGVLALVALPLLLTGLIQVIIGDLLWGLPQFLFALLVLLYCLGPEDLDSQVLDYLDSEDRGDNTRAKGFASQLCEAEAGQDRSARVRQLTDAVLLQSQRRLFAVVFWFFLLGPVGAMLYRLSNQLLQMIPCDDEHQSFNQGNHRLLEILDWLPTRLVVFSFALAGSFEGTMHAWDEWKNQPDDGPDALLLAAGKGAMGLSPDSDDELLETAQVEASLSLVWRGLTIWLVVMGLLTIGL